MGVSSAVWVGFPVTVMKLPSGKNPVKQASFRRGKSGGNGETLGEYNQLAHHFTNLKKVGFAREKTYSISRAE